MNVNRPMGAGAGMRGSGFYIPGMGTYGKEALVYENDIGERVVQSAGLLRNQDGSLHKAYSVAPGTQNGSAYEKALAGLPLSPDEEFALRQLAGRWGFNTQEDVKILAYKLSKVFSEGLPSVNDLGGNHNGGIETKVGTADKNTTSASNFSRAQRRSSTGRMIAIGGFGPKGNSLR